MDERHENEQYFFDVPTLERLTAFLAAWHHPCCVCCPLLGARLEADGVGVAILDIDERFEYLKGFQKYDVRRPHWIDKKFDIIMCDPPFYNVPLRQFFIAVRMLSHHDFSQPLLVAYLKRRQETFLRTFSEFNLKPMGFSPTYESVQHCPKNDIELYGNIAPKTLSPWE